MSEKNDSKSGDSKIGNIKRKEIFIGWNNGKSLRQIAQEMDLSIAIVSQNLKPIQKVFIKQGG